MKILFIGLAVFCLAFIIHLLIWKIRLPNKQTKALLGLFCTTIFICLLILSFFLRIEVYEYLHLFIFYISLMLAYITTYSAIEVDSPSLVMVINIAESGKGGLDEEKFREILNDERLVKPRINDLVRDRMIYLISGKYKLTRAGFLLSHVFIIFRKLLNTGKGG